MDSRIPSGNWFANIGMRHSGRNNAAKSRAPAPSTPRRARGEITCSSQAVSDTSASPARRGSRPAPGLHQEVALHLLVHRRAEVGAVERIHPRLRRPERDRLHLARIHHDVDVVQRDPEAVEHVAFLLAVGDVDDHRVALIHLDGAGEKYERIAYTFASTMLPRRVTLPSSARQTAFGSLFSAL